MYLKFPNVSTFTRNPHLLYCLLACGVISIVTVSYFLLAEKRIQNEHESSLVLRPFRQTRLFGRNERPGFVAPVEAGAKYGFQ
jgi:hypothetical protein